MSKPSRTVKKSGKNPSGWEPKSPYEPKNSKSKPRGSVMNARNK